MKLLPTLFFAGFLLILIAGIAYADPAGTNPLTGTTSRGADLADIYNLTAQAGNVTQVNIDVISITNSWQGFYGNISNAIVLQNANNQSFYNWSDTNPSGEVYAARVNNINWATINCTDAGNISAEETAMGMVGYGDSLSNTFNQNSHAGFVTGSRTFSPNECNSTNPFNSTGGTNNFDNIVLTDGDDIVYASILEDNHPGFDTGTYDFQLLVAENGRGANATILTPYYFWVELN